MNTEKTEACWLSRNEGKAWTEKWFMIYSPIWMAMMGIIMLLGVDEKLGNVSSIILGLVIALPLLVVPALKSPENKTTLWHQTYWFKINVYLFLFSFFGNYFGSEYFFDVLGMVYSYPHITWNLDAALVGSGEKVVPFLMYLLTHAYFATYHSTATVVMRRFKTSGLPGMLLLYPLVVFVIGYIWAWLETKAMANPMIEESFYYEKMDAMLAYGSMYYALYFIGSFPIYLAMDENREKPWTLTEAIFASLAASMIVFYLLDFATWIIGGSL